MSQMFNFFSTRNLLDLDFLLNFSQKSAEFPGNIQADARDLPSDAFDVLSLLH